MFRNYLTVALRNLVKHRLYSAINIAGLAIGLAASILILLFVRNETSYDRFFTDAGRIYQPVIQGLIPGRPPQWLANTGLAWAPAYKQDHPEVEDFARVVRQRSAFRVGESQFYEDVRLVDTNFFSMFDFRFVHGDRSTALSDPSGIVLTESVARKYFGDEDPVGRTINLDNQFDVRVTGVMEDMPSDTHFDLPVVLPFNSVAARNLRQLEQNWGALCCHTYVRFKEGADIAKHQAEVAAWMKRTAPTLQTPQGPIALGDMMIPRLRPLTSIHTDPMDADATPGISMTEIYTFSAIAVLVLAIASINFMNLATARATQRAREVSVRKVVGASRRQIVIQFIGESVLLTLIGLILAVALAELALPWYSDFLGKDLALDYGDPGLMLMLLGLTVVVGIAGGAYPAFFLSSFNPAKVLKGSASGVGGGSGRLRAALVVVQFSISIGLMVATAVVHGQLLFAQNKDLGFDKENVVIVSGWGARAIRDKRESFVDALRRDPRVAAASSGSFVPTQPDESNTSVNRPGADAAANIIMRNDAVDFGYFQTLGMRFVAGRDFDRDRGTDAIQRPDWQIANQEPPAGTGNITLPGGVVVNRAALGRLGFTSPEAALDQVLEVADGANSTLRLTIIGVVEDFHFRSIHDPIAGAVFYIDPQALDTVVVRLRAGQTREGLEAIDRVWREFVPDRPIQRTFLDDNLQALYQREAKMSQVFATFSGLAILIACLGLFGLASFTAERKTKEIGLRKVLGASVTDIVRLLVWQFSKPVLVANLIAWPIAWYGMSRWLEGFTYRIDMNPLLFLLAGGLALAIAWLTVGLHAARVAQAKPVSALRYE